MPETDEIGLVRASAEARVDVVEKRRPWARGLFDEGFIRWMNSEEFPSEPVFNQQIHRDEAAAREVFAYFLTDQKVG
ncbi:MAG: hypothetical protein Q7R60_02650 [bacterium]|nr:hypothetical protein [bacterium]